MRMPEGGHGSMLSPMPPLKAGSVAQRLLRDPPNFRPTSDVDCFCARCQALQSAAT